MIGLVGRPTPALPSAPYQTARGLLAAASSAQPVTVMASPPTVTQGTANAASTINGNSIYAPAVSPTDTRLTRFGGNLQYNSPGNGSYTFLNASPSTVNTTAMGGFAFVFDGQTFDFCIRDLTNSQFRIKITSLTGATAGAQWAQVADYAPSTTAGSSFYYFKVDLGSRDLRLIEVFFAASMQLMGFNFQAFTSIAAAPISRPSMLVIGDSYTNRVGSTNINEGFVTKLAEYLGTANPTPSGVGGQGYNVNGNNGGQTLVQRVGDVSAYGLFDLTVVAAGINDVAQSAATVQSQAASFWSQAFALNPNGIFVCVGPWRAPSKNPPQAISDAIKAGFLSVYDPSRSFFVDTFAENWQNGTTYNGTGTQDGNAYWYVGLDGTHYNTDGHRYLGAGRLGAAIVRGLRSLAQL